MAELNTERLYEIFTQDQTTQRIPNLFTNNTRQIYRNGISGIYGNSRCPGRAIMKVYSESIGQYYRNNMYNYISSFCTHIKQMATGTEQIYVLNPYWLQITQEDHDNHRFTIASITNMLWQQTMQNNRIHRVRLVHIASGKSYLREILDNDEDVKISANRIKSMEMYLIRNTSHFIRVYSKFPNTEETDLVVFTDIVDERLIQQLYLQFPNIFNLTGETLCRELQQINPVGSDAYTQQALKIVAFRDLFSMLYDYTHPTSDTTITIEAIQNAIKTFCEFFATQSGEIEKFITKLSTAQNDKLIRNLKQTISNADSNIRSYENYLEQYYNQRADAQRQLNAIRNAEAADVSEFRNILLNNKAIEILEAYNSELRLRITLPLLYFQSSDFEAYERNVNSKYRQDYQSVPMQRVMHKIFVERKYIMPIQAVIRMVIDTSSSNSIISLYADSNGDNYTTLANPHLRYYDCWREAKNNITQCIAKAEYDLALMTMLAAVQTVNIAENPTFVERTLRDIRNLDISKTIILTNAETKETISFPDAVKLEAKLLEEETKKAEEAASPPEARGYTQVIVEEEDIDEELETLDDEMIREAEDAFERSVTNEVHQDQ